MGLLPKDPRKQRLVVIGLVPFALAFAFYQFVWAPKAAELATTEEHVVALESANKQADQAMRHGRVESIRAEAKRSEENLALMRTLVPTGNEVPALLEQVSTAARRVGLEIASVEPEPVIAGDQFDTYRYRLSVTGAYHPVGQFLTSVGSLTRIIAPVNLSLASAPESRTAKKLPQGRSMLETKFEIQTYVAKTEPPPDGRRRPVKSEDKS